MSVKPIPILDRNICIIADKYSGSYGEAKTYLGKNINARDSIYIQMTFMFDDMDGVSKFFDFWVDKLLGGALPFFAHIPVFGKFKDYLIVQVGELTTTFEPDHTVRGKFMLFNNTSKDQIAAPIVDDIILTVPEGSQNVTIPLKGYDPNGLPLTYLLVGGTVHGTSVIAGSSLIYDSKRGYEGKEVISYRVYNGLHYSNTGKITITLTHRETFFFSPKNSDFFDVSHGSGSLLTVKEDA